MMMRNVLQHYCTTYILYICFIYPADPMPADDADVEQPSCIIRVTAAAAAVGILDHYRSHHACFGVAYDQ